MVAGHRLQARMLVLLCPKNSRAVQGQQGMAAGIRADVPPDRLDSPRHVGTQYYNAFPKGSTVFVCSMADLFGSWVPDEWITRVMDAAVRVPRHTYIFLTKNPTGTCSSQDHISTKKISGSGRPSGGKSPLTGKGRQSPKTPAPNKFISFEPLLCGSREWDLTGIGR